MDKTGRLIVAMLAIKGDLSEQERTQAVADLIENGLTISDIAELIPQLLAPCPATLSETGSDRPPVTAAAFDLGFDACGVFEEAAPQGACP